MVKAEIIPTGKTPGLLNRHVQGKIGETLRAMFDEIVNEGVPDRFSELLGQIESRVSEQSKGSTAGSEAGAEGSDRPPCASNGDKEPS